MRETFCVSVASPRLEASGCIGCSKGHQVNEWLRFKFGIHLLPRSLSLLPSLNSCLCFLCPLVQPLLILTTLLLGVWVLPLGPCFPAAGFG